ncbi:MAG: transglutaminase family protein [Cyclobacteriaceae bacterium]
MRLSIEHITSYEYGASVFLEPHHLYFYPSYRPHIDLVSFEMEVSPRPSGLSIRLNAENDSYHQCWFNDQLDRVSFRAAMVLDIAEINPFDFLIEDSPKTDHEAILDVYRHPKLQMSPGLTKWSNEMAQLTDGNPITFLSMLNKEINLGWKHKIRYEYNLMTPDDCFLSKEGSCRDLSWMMIQILRNQNIPARFVSGYAYNPELIGHELHAWVEAWVSGAGWIGLDPSAGLFVNDAYVPITASYHPYNTLPVQGTYKGDAASKLTTEVNIESLD